MCRFPEKGEAGYRSFFVEVVGKVSPHTLSWMFRGHENLRVSVSGYPCAIRSSGKPQEAAKAEDCDFAAETSSRQHCAVDSVSWITGSEAQGEIPPAVFQKG